MRTEDQLFQKLVEDVPVGITIFRGPEFVVDMANDTYLQLVDRSKEFFLGKPLFEVLPEVKDYVEPLLNDVYRNGRPYYGSEFEVVLNRHGRKEITYFNFVYHPLREDNEVTGIMVVAIDITETVKRKRFLQESEKKFRGLIDHSPIAMTIFRGKELIVEIANKTLLDKIWRRKAEEVIGRPLLEVFPELKGQPFPALLTEVLRTGKVHQEKEALAYVDAEDGLRAFYLDYEYSPLFNEGEADGIMVTVNDVTDRVRARMRVEESEERARLAMEASKAGIFDIDIKTGKINCSPRFFEIFGMPVSSDHVDVLSRVYPEDLPVRQKAHMEAMETGTLYYEIRIMTEQNGIRWIRAQGKLYRDAEGEAVRLLGTIDDITQKVIAEQSLKSFAEELEKKVQERTRELQIANDELAVRNQELMSFNYISSHDLQEPLRKIQTFASRITSTESALSPENRIYFQKMQQSAKQMQMLIRDLLEYSRAGEGERVFEEVDLGEVIGTIRQQLLDGGPEPHALEIHVGAMPVVSAIPFQMQQLFANLLSNAVKFSRKKEKSVVHVEVLPEVADFHVIRVRDNGVGFLPEYREHIFEVFRRLHHKSEYEGTGIGLAICKKIVENHRGFITADSTPGEGALFTVFLPVAL